MTVTIASAHRRRRTCGLVLALAALATVIPASPASAHSQLVSSTPEADSSIAALPTQFSITMNEDLLDLAGDGSGFALQVTDEAGRFYGDGCLSIDGPTLAIGASIGEPGQYRMVYQVVSEDGHPVSAELTFTWTGRATGTGSSTAPECGQTVPSFVPSPTATAPAAPADPATSNPATSAPPPESDATDAGASTLPIVLGVLGVLAVAALIALAAVRRRRD